MWPQPSTSQGSFLENGFRTVSKPGKAEGHRPCAGSPAPRARPFGEDAFLELQTCSLATHTYGRCGGDGSASVRRKATWAVVNSLLLTWVFQERSISGLSKEPGGRLGTSGPVSVRFRGRLYGIGGLLSTTPDAPCCSGKTLPAFSSGHSILLLRLSVLFRDPALGHLLGLPTRCVHQQTPVHSPLALRPAQASRARAASTCAALTATGTCPPPPRSSFSFPCGSSAAQQGCCQWKQMTP